MIYQYPDFGSEKISGAVHKLVEAEFFFGLMKTNTRGVEFSFYLSAFLSALFSCTEHNRLLSVDARFQDWYQQIKLKYLADPVLVQLRDVRNKEVHHVGVPCAPTEGFRFSAGLGNSSPRRIVIEMDNDRTGTYKTDDMEESASCVRFETWIWPNGADVIDLCSRGFAVIRSLMQDREAMKFSD